MTPPESSSGFIHVGRITKPHGLAGAVEVINFSDNPNRFDPGNTFMLSPDVPAPPEVRIKSCFTKKGRFVIKFEGFDSREQAEALPGRELLIPAEEARKPRDAFWIHDLIGCRVVTVSGRDIGVVEEVLETGGNDVYVVAGEKKYYIPAVEQVVKDINIDESVIKIDPLPGLLDL